MLIEPVEEGRGRENLKPVTPSIMYKRQIQLFDVTPPIFNQHLPMKCPNANTYLVVRGDVEILDVTA
jgi:hypothetical protein